MHSHLAHSLPLFGFGLFGVLIMAFVKMNDINKLSDNHTFRFVFNKFWQREWPSYGLSIIIIGATALTHEEWVGYFTSTVKEKFGMPLGVNLSMISWGFIGQYVVYKILGKMTKGLK